MPYLKIQTNRHVDAGRRTELLVAASRLVADILGKPERYVMVALEADVSMVFAASDAPLVYLELKSIGLDEAATAGLSEHLCRLMDERLQVPAERVYIEFANAPRHMWGWNGATF